MSSIGITQRIIIFSFLSIYTFSQKCLATDGTDEEDREYSDNDVFSFTTKKLYIWETWTYEPTYKPPRNYGDKGFSGRGDPTIFFVILGVGILIFIGLLFLCKRARDQTNSRTIPGTPVPHAPTARDGGVDVNISVIGSASSNPSQGRPGISRQISEKPPDYAAVTLGDLRNAKLLFPSVMRQKSSETPPPKYDENNPMFK